MYHNEHSGFPHLTWFECVAGKVPVKESIECIASKAIQGDVFVGLATDEDNLYDETDGRIEKWTTQLKTEGCA